MKFYITTPIYYVNDRPHIGHVYTTTIADIVARYHRLCGDEVFFLTGTDEHAAKVVDSAAEHGMTPQQWADQNAQAFQDTFAKLGIANDDFVRTSQPRHKAKVQEYVGELLKTGDVYLGEYEGWYDAGQEEYLPENKAKESEYKSPVNGKPLVRKKEKNYFFRLSKYSDALLKLLEERPDFVRPDVRRNEVLSRIREGLNDVPVSRAGASEWGIRVPGDDSHTIYVWIDALFNYLSTVDTPERLHFWPADVHLIAKEILWFHAVIWPAMLIALKRELPRQVYAHSFWISEGRKMSKSLGNFIDLEKIDGYIANFGLDSFRYFLARHGPLGINDSDFADARFNEVYNAELADKMGNLVNRTLTMIQRYRACVVPERNDEALRAAAEEMVSTYRENMGRLDLVGALGVLWDFVVRSNQYVEESAPWKLAKDPASTRQLDGVLYNLAESVRLISVLVTPVMPTIAQQIRVQLGVTEKLQVLAEEIGWGRLAPGDEDRADCAVIPETHMIQLPESSRFHVIDESKVLPRFGHLTPRPIYVYLPELAEHDHRRRFPVLYCHDGQNIWDDPHCCFGHGGWYLNQIADELTREGKMEPTILVGIPNTPARYREYTPGKTYDDILSHPYANYVVDVVKRSVDRKFPTKKDRQHTALLGSSLGGLISLWMAHKLPETFRQAACLSGALQVRDRQKKSFIDFVKERERVDLRIYLDCGTVQDGAPQSRKLHQAYLTRGWREGEDLCYFEDKGGEHNERCWRDRVWRALMFLFGSTNPPK